MINLTSNRELPSPHKVSSVSKRSILVMDFKLLFDLGRKVMDDSLILRIVVVGVFSWTGLFLFIRKALFPKHSFEFCNRIVSITHGVVAVTLASLTVRDWSCPVCPVASKSSPSQMETLAVSLSYFSYDLVCCMLDKQTGLDFAVHHLVSLVGLVAGLTYQKSGSELIAALWVTEISSPFLHLRDLLKELGYRDTDLNLAADISFAIVFTFARMVCGPYLTWVTIVADNPILIKAMSLGLQLVSAFWFYKIVRMAKYKLTKRVAAPKKIAKLEN